MALGVGEHETQNGSVAIKTLATVVDQHHNVDDSNAIQQDQTSVQNGNSTAENNDKSNAIKSTKLVSHIAKKHTAKDIHSFCFLKELLNDA